MFLVFGYDSKNESETFYHLACMKIHYDFM